MAETRWFHPPLNGGEEQGLNEAGVEVFKKPKSLARETCQNIGDARRAGSDTPAVATFELVNLPASEFPGLKQLCEAFEACRDHVLKNVGTGTGNEKVFFERAIELLQGSSIPTLRIGDENTTGLTGADQNRHLPFFRLLRGQGYSNLQGVGGGTYGIGQRAPFAHSALRTVLYGSRLLDGSELFIAKNILASFPDPRNGGDLTQSKGWWCEVMNPGAGQWRTIREPTKIPTRFRREKAGTDLWVTGCLIEDWERSIRHSALEHFFAAIANGQLVIRIVEAGSAPLEISAANLADQLQRAAEEAKAHETRDEYRQGLGATIYFDKALRQPLNGKPFTRDIDHIGEVQLYVYRDVKDSDAPERWAKMRKPRILVDHSGSTLLSRYAAVLLCDNKAGSDFLAEMEDPKHEKWDEDEARNWSPAQRKAGATVRKAILKFVRDTLKQVRGEDAGAAQDLPFLGQYLPAEEDIPADTHGSANQPSDETTTNETGHRVTLKVPTTQGRATLTRRKPSLDARLSGTKTRKATGGKGTQGGGGDDEGGGGGGGNGGGDGGDGDRGTQGGKGDGDAGGKDGEGKTGEGPRTINPTKVRFRSFERDGGYELVLHSDRDLLGDLRLRSVGEDASRYDLRISQATDLVTGQALEFDGSTIKAVKLIAGQTHRLRVAITSPVKLCLTLGS